MGGGSKTSTGIQFWSIWSLYIYGIAKNLFKEQFYHVHGKYVMFFSIHLLFKTLCVNFSLPRNDSALVLQLCPTDLKN